MAAKKNRRRGRFIVFEGIDGSGTTTQATMTMEWLLRRGELVYMTAEPSQGPIGVMLRQALRGRLLSQPIKPGGQGKAVPLDPTTLALLFAADRQDHLQNEILPHLEAGYHVICDRYLLSSYAYQSLELDTRFVRQINEKALAPDLTFFLRVRPEVGMDRIAMSRSGREAFDKLALQRQIAENYDKLLKDYRDGQVEILDGEPELSIVTTKVRAILEPHF